MISRCIKLTHEETEVLQKSKPFSVRGNADQIEKLMPQLIVKFAVEPLRSSRQQEPVYVNNSVTARFDNKQEADELYQLMQLNKMVAFRNWFD